MLTDWSPLVRRKKLIVNCKQHLNFFFLNIEWCSNEIGTTKVQRYLEHNQNVFQRKV